MNATLTNLTWHTMPRDAGQMFAISYACDDEHEYIYRRSIDGSTKRETIDRAEWIDGDFEPQNGMLPKMGKWQPLQ